MSKRQITATEVFKAACEVRDNPAKYKAAKSWSEAGRMLTKAMKFPVSAYSARNLFEAVGLVIGFEDPAWQTVPDAGGIDALRAELAEAKKAINEVREEGFQLVRSVQEKFLGARGRLEALEIRQRSVDSIYQGSDWKRMAEDVSRCRSDIKELSKAVELSGKTIERLAGDLDRLNSQVQQLIGQPTS